MKRRWYQNLTPARFFTEGRPWLLPPKLTQAAGCLVQALSSQRRNQPEYGTNLSLSIHPIVERGKESPPDFPFVLPTREWSPVWAKTILATWLKIPIGFQKKGLLDQMKRGVIKHLKEAASKASALLQPDCWRSLPRVSWSHSIIQF